MLELPRDVYNSIVEVIQSCSDAIKNENEQVALVLNIREGLSQLDDGNKVRLPISGNIQEEHIPSGDIVRWVNSDRVVAAFDPMHVLVFLARLGFLEAKKEDGRIVFEVDFKLADTETLLN